MVGIIFNKILVPINDSFISEGILQYVAQIASVNNSEVTLLTVVNDSNDDAASTMRLSSLAQYFVQKGIKVDFKIESSDDPAASIIEISNTFDYDLIAMSTRGRSGITRAILGSTMATVLKMSKIPILALNPEESSKYDTEARIITDMTLALDGSVISEAAIPFVTNLAQSMNIPVKLSRVLTSSELIPNIITTAGMDPYIGEHAEHTRSQAKEHLLEIKRRLNENSIRVKACDVLEGNIVNTLIDSADSLETDLFVITTHGKSGIKRMVMGSVADAIIRASYGPILIIPSIGAVRKNTRKKITLPEARHRLRQHHHMPTVLLSLAALCIVISLFIPYWHMNLDAPQYPEGLSAAVYVNKVVGDVSEIDGLNHYIGMRPLEDAAKFERSMSIFAVVFLSLILNGAIFMHNKYVVFLIVPVLLYPIIFIVDLYIWLRFFGQNLDPTAALSSSVDPFTPPLLGSKEVANFFVSGQFGIGFYCVCLSVFFALLGLYFHKKSYEPLVKIIKKATRIKRFSYSNATKYY